MVLPQHAHSRTLEFSTCVDAVVGMPVYLGWKLGTSSGYQPSALDM